MAPRPTLRHAARWAALDDRRHPWRTALEASHGVVRPPPGPWPWIRFVLYVTVCSTLTCGLLGGGSSYFLYELHWRWTTTNSTTWPLVVEEWVCSSEPCITVSINSTG